MGVEVLRKIDRTIKFNEQVHFLMSKLEADSKFKNSDLVISKYVYHLYSKIKRTFKSIDVILKSDIKNSYIETIPLLRIIVESYFHIAYINKNKSRMRLIASQYENLAKLELFNLGKYYHYWSLETDIHQDYLDVIKNHYAGKKEPNVPNKLKKVYLLAKEVGRYDFYVELYTLMSGFVHFSPNTRNLHGEQQDDTFTFNKYVYDEEADYSIRFHLIQSIILAIGCIENIFELDDYRVNILAPASEDWHVIRQMRLKAPQ